MPGVILKRPQREKLCKCSHNLFLAVVDIQGFEHHSACYISMIFSVTELKSSKRCKDEGHTVPVHTMKVYGTVRT